MTTSLRSSYVVYRTLLFIYPRDFRLRFGTEMLATFSDQICDEWQQNGLLGALRVWFSALGELISVAVPLRLRNSIVVAMSL